MIAATEAAVAGAVERLERADRTGTPCRPVRDLIGVEDLTSRMPSSVVSPAGG
jgi:hypothetical protein